jgi:LysM repeat protein
VSRSRRKPKAKPGLAHFGAPIAFLAAVTAAVLLVHSALHHDPATTTSTRTATQHVVTTTATAKKHGGSRKQFYTVQSGDTFGSIAGKEGITIAQLESLNPGVSSNALQVGQKLRIK